MKKLLLHQNVINEFKKENKLNKSEGPLGTLYWLDEEEKGMVKEYEEKWNVLVYHVIKTFTKDMFDGLEILDYKQSGRVATMVIRGDKSFTKLVMSELHPVLVDELELTLEEMFVYEKEGVKDGK